MNNTQIDFLFALTARTFREIATTIDRYESPYIISEALNDLSDRIYHELKEGLDNEAT